MPGMSSLGKSVAFLIFSIGGRILLASQPADFAPAPLACPLVLTVSLAPNSAPPAVGRNTAIHLEIENRGNVVKVFNPFLNPLLALPIEMRIYDLNREHVATISDKAGMGSRRLPGEYDYVELPSSGGVCIDWIWHPAMIDRPFRDADGKPHETLPPGKYFMEAVAYKALITFDKLPANDITGDQMSHFWDHFDRSELCKSNMLPIVIAETK